MVSLFAALEQRGYAPAQTQQAQPSSWLDRLEPGNALEIARNEAMPDIHEMYRLREGRVFDSDDEALNHFLNDRNFGELNTLGTLRDISYQSTATDAQVGRLARLQRLYQAMPAFWQEGGRGASALPSIAGAVLSDPLNLIGGLSGVRAGAMVGRQITTNALRTASAAAVRAGGGQLSREAAEQVVRSTAANLGTSLRPGVGTAARRGAVRGGISEAAVGAGTEAVAESLVQARDIELGIQDDYSLLQTGFAAGAGGALSGAMGSIFGAVGGVSGLRRGAGQALARTMDGATDGRPNITPDGLEYLRSLAEAEQAPPAARLNTDPGEGGVVERIAMARRDTTAALTDMRERIVDQTAVEADGGLVGESQVPQMRAEAEALERHIQVIDQVEAWPTARERISKEIDDLDARSKTDKGLSDSEAEALARLRRERAVNDTMFAQITGEGVSHRQSAIIARIADRGGLEPRQWEPVGTRTQEADGQAEGRAGDQTGGDAPRDAFNQAEATVTVDDAMVRILSDAGLLDPTTNEIDTTLATAYSGETDTDPLTTFFREELRRLREAQDAPAPEQPATRPQPEPDGDAQPSEGADAGQPNDAAEAAPAGSEKPLDDQEGVAPEAEEATEQVAEDTTEQVAEEAAPEAAPRPEAPSSVLEPADLEALPERYRRYAEPTGYDDIDADVANLLSKATGVDAAADVDPATKRQVLNSLVKTIETLKREASERISVAEPNRPARAASQEAAPRSLEEAMHMAAPGETMKEYINFFVDHPLAQKLFLAKGDRTERAAQIRALWKQNGKTNTAAQRRRRGERLLRMGLLRSQVYEETIYSTNGDLTVLFDDDGWYSYLQTLDPTTRQRVQDEGVREAVARPFAKKLIDEITSNETWSSGEVMTIDEIIEAVGLEYPSQFATDIASEFLTNPRAQRSVSFDVAKWRPDGFTRLNDADKELLIRRARQAWQKLEADTMPAAQRGIRYQEYFAKMVRDRLGLNDTEAPTPPRRPASGRAPGPDGSDIVEPPTTRIDTVVDERGNIQTVKATVGGGQAVGGRVQIRDLDNTRRVGRPQQAIRKAKNTPFKALLSGTERRRMTELANRLGEEDISDSVRTDLADKLDGEVRKLAPILQRELSPYLADFGDARSGRAARSRFMRVLDDIEETVLPKVDEEYQRLRVALDEAANANDGPGMASAADQMRKLREAFPGETIHGGTTTRRMSGVRVATDTVPMATGAGGGRTNVTLASKQVSWGQGGDFIVEGGADGSGPRRFDLKGEVQAALDKRRVELKDPRRREDGSVVDANEAYERRVENILERYAGQDESFLLQIENAIGRLEEADHLDTTRVAKLEQWRRSVEANRGIETDLKEGKGPSDAQALMAEIKELRQKAKVLREGRDFARADAARNQIARKSDDLRKAIEAEAKRRAEAEVKAQQEGRAGTEQAPANAEPLPGAKQNAPPRQFSVETYLVDLNRDIAITKIDDATREITLRGYKNGSAPVARIITGKKGEGSFLYVDPAAMGKEGSSPRAFRLFDSTPVGPKLMGLIAPTIRRLGKQGVFPRHPNTTVRDVFEVAPRDVKTTVGDPANAETWLDFRPSQLSDTPNGFTPVISIAGDDGQAVLRVSRNDATFRQVAGKKASANLTLGVLPDEVAQRLSSTGRGKTAQARGDYAEAQRLAAQHFTPWNGPVRPLEGDMDPTPGAQRRAAGKAADNFDRIRFEQAGTVPIKPQLLHPLDRKSGIKRLDQALALAGELESRPLIGTDMVTIKARLDAVYDAIDDAAPNGVTNHSSTQGRLRAIKQVQAIYADADDASVAAIVRFLSRLNTNRLPQFRQGAENAFVSRDPSKPEELGNYISLAPNGDGVLNDAYTFVHEMGHWLWANVLSSKEKRAFYDVLAERANDQGGLSVEALDDLLPFTAEVAEKIGSNQLDTAGEVFANQLMAYMLRPDMGGGLMQRMREITADDAIEVQRQAARQMAAEAVQSGNLVDVSVASIMRLMGVGDDYVQVPPALQDIFDAVIPQRDAANSASAYNIGEVIRRSPKGSDGKSTVYGNTFIAAIDKLDGVRAHIGQVTIEGPGDASTGAFNDLRRSLYAIESDSPNYFIKGGSGTTFAKKVAWRAFADARVRKERAGVVEASRRLEAWRQEYETYVEELAGTGGTIDPDELASGGVATALPDTMSDELDLILEEVTAAVDAFQDAIANNYNNLSPEVPLVRTDRPTARQARLKHSKNVNEIFRQRALQRRKIDRMNAVADASAYAEAVEKAVAEGKDPSTVKAPDKPKQGRRSRAGAARTRQAGQSKDFIKSVNAMSPAELAERIIDPAQADKVKFYGEALRQRMAKNLQEKDLPKAPADEVRKARGLHKPVLVDRLAKAMVSGDEATEAVLANALAKSKPFKNAGIKVKDSRVTDAINLERADGFGLADPTSALPPGAPEHVRNLAGFFRHRDRAVERSLHMMVYRLHNLLPKRGREALSEARVMSVADLDKLIGRRSTPGTAASIAIAPNTDGIGELRGKLRRVAVGLTPGSSDTTRLGHEIGHMLLRLRDDIWPTEKMTAEYRAAIEDGDPVALNMATNRTDISMEDRAEEWFVERFGRFAQGMVADGYRLRSWPERAIRQLYEMAAYLVNGLIRRDSTRQQFRRMLYFGDMTAEPRSIRNTVAESGIGGVVPEMAGEYVNDVLTKMPAQQRAAIETFAGRSIKDAVYLQGGPEGALLEEVASPALRGSEAPRGPGIYLMKGHALRQAMPTDSETLARLADETGDVDLAVEAADLHLRMAEATRDLKQARIDGDEFGVEVSLDAIDDINDMLAGVWGRIASKGGRVPHVAPMVVRARNTLTLTADQVLSRPQVRAIADMAKRNRLVDAATHQDLVTAGEITGDDLYSTITRSAARIMGGDEEARSALHQALVASGYDSIEVSLPTLDGDTAHALVMFSPDDVRHLESDDFDWLGAEVLNSKATDSVQPGDSAGMMAIQAAIDESFDKTDPITFLRAAEGKGATKAEQKFLGKVLRDNPVSSRIAGAAARAGAILNSPVTRLRKQGMNWLADQLRVTDNGFDIDVEQAELSGRYMREIVPDLERLSGMTVVERWGNRTRGLWSNPKTPEVHTKILNAIRTATTAKNLTELNADEKAVARKIIAFFEQNLEDLRAAGAVVGDVRKTLREKGLLYYVPQTWDAEAINRDFEGFVSRLTRKIVADRRAHNLRLAPGRGFAEDTMEADAAKTARDVATRIVDEDPDIMDGIRGIQGLVDEHTSLSRVLVLEGSDYMREALGDYLINDLETLVVKYADSSARRQTLTRRFGHNNFALKDYLITASDGRKGVARRLVGDLTTVRTRRGMEGAGEIETVLMPAIYKQNATDIATLHGDISGWEAMAAANPAKVQAEIETTLLGRAAERWGDVPEAYAKEIKKRASAIAGGLKDFTAKGQVPTGRETNYAEEVIRLNEGRAVDEGLHRGYRDFSRFLRNYNGITKLGFVTLTSFTDIALPLVRSGDFGAWVKSLPALLGKNPEYMAAARRIGLAIEQQAHDAAQARLGMASTRRGSAFYNMIGLAPWTTRMRNFAGVVAYESFAAEIGKAKRLMATGATEESSRELRSSMAYLRHFDLDDFVTEGKHFGSLEELADKPEYQRARMGMIKFANETIFAPNQNDLPVWTRTWWGSIIFQLKSFSLMYGRLFGSLVGKAAKGDAKAQRSLAYLGTAGAAMGAGALLSKDLVQARGGEEDRQVAPRDRLASEWFSEIGMPVPWDAEGKMDQAAGWYWESILHMGGFGLVADTLYNAAAASDNGAWGRMRMLGIIGGPSVGSLDSWLQIASGAGDALTGEGGADARAAVRNAAMQVPVLGQVRGLREGATDTLAGPAQNGGGGRPGGGSLSGLDLEGFDIGGF